jgi:hypothetical protein
MRTFQQYDDVTGRLAAARSEVGTAAEDVRHIGVT